MREACGRRRYLPCSRRRHLLKLFRPYRWALSARFGGHAWRQEHFFVLDRQSLLSPQEQLPSSSGAAIKPAARTTSSQLQSLLRYLKIA